MDSSAQLRLAIFLGVFALMGVIEAYRPARKAVLNRKERWIANLSMVVLGAVIARLLLPSSLVGVSLWAKEANIGLFNVNAAETLVPYWLEVMLCVLILDVIIYWQHRLFHVVPILWRVHKMHHADSHVDTTTGLRFHPIEIAISLGVKAFSVVLLGAPILAIVIFEVALNGFSLFNHANIRLPQKWDDRVSTILITQRLHRIHHSQAKTESSSNYGFSVSWWDKLFSSFTPTSTCNDETLNLGQKDVPAHKSNATVTALLMLPFLKSRNKN